MTDDSPSRPDPAPIDDLATLAERLSRAVREDEDARQAALAVGRWLVRLAEHAQGAAEEPGREIQSAVESKPAAAAQVTTQLMIGGASREVTVQQADPQDAAAASASPAPASAPPAERTEHGPDGPAARADEAPVDLSLVVQRARVKARCCRWAIERRRRLDDGADFDMSIRPEDHALKAVLEQLPDCIAWPLDPYRSLPDDRTLEDCAGCYDVLADAVEMIESVRGSAFVDDYREAAYELLAEATSALRWTLLQDCDVTRDLDQDTVYNWLCEQSYADRVFIRRHMRADDPAQPSDWPDRQDRVAALVDEVSQRAADGKKTKNLFGKVTYTCGRFTEWPASEQVSRAERLVEHVEQLLDLGVKPSDPRLREAIAPIVDDLPDGLGAGTRFEQVLRYIDEHASRRETEAPGQPSPGPDAPEVAQAADLLADCIAVMIGGECRVRSRDQLQRGLGLRELRWISTRPHESLQNFEAQVRRPDVDLVMLAIRWSSHSFEEVKHICERYGKPFVRLPAGYGLNRVACEIVTQASSSLLERTGDRARSEATGQTT